MYLLLDKHRVLPLGGVLTCHLRQQKQQAVVALPWPLRYIGRTPQQCHGFVSSLEPTSRTTSH